MLPNHVWMRSGTACVYRVLYKVYYSTWFQVASHIWPLLRSSLFPWNFFISLDTRLMAKEVIAVITIRAGDVFSYFIGQIM